MVKQNKTQKSTRFPIRSIGRWLKQQWKSLKNNHKSRIIMLEEYR